MLTALKIDRKIEMADISGETPYAVAFALLERIAFAEKWPTGTVTGAAVWGKTRKEILDTYAECLVAVQAPNSRNMPP